MKLAEKENFPNPYLSFTNTHQHQSCQYDHDFLYRTQSEDSPKSPLDMTYIKPLSGYMMTTAEIHSRASSRQSQLETSRSDTMSTDNFFIDSYHSQDSGNTCRSASSYEHNSSMNSQDNLIISRRASHTLQTEPIFIGRNELEAIQVRNEHGVHEYESHSLPRRTCIHHSNEEYHSHSLPRREHHHHFLHEKLSNGNAIDMGEGRQRRMSASYQDAQPSYVNMNVTPDTYSLSRRSSTHLQQVPTLSINLQKYQQPPPPQHHYQHHQQQVVPPSEELCSTCSSETESTSNSEDESESENEEDEEKCPEEKEIFIDFKPRISPTPSPNSVATKKKKKLMKAMSEGEILLEDNCKGKQLPIHSASDEDLGLPQTDYSKKQLEYGDAPIRDEDIFKTDNFMNVSPDSSSSSNRYNRETFRKRSVSLEDPMAEEVTKKSNQS
jgi:hypothetical protein